MTLAAIRADIATLAADAIVDPANPSLLCGGGVDGAIHRAAGSNSRAECRTIGGCDTGDAKIAQSCRPPARYAIHTVGPVWRDRTAGEDDLLASGYRRSLSLARDRSIGSSSFPSISTGAYGFPAERAAAVAVATVSDEIAAEPGTLTRVAFCCCDVQALSLHRAVVRRHGFAVP